MHKQLHVHRVPRGKGKYYGRPGARAESRGLATVFYLVAIVGFLLSL